MRFRIALCTVLFAFPTFAATVTVGCAGGPPGDYPTITAAVAALDLDGPHTINVSGTCSESVLLDQRERLTIQGPATVNGGAQPAFLIRNSGHVLLRALTTSGLRAAISVENRSSATLMGVIAENATNGAAVDAFGGATVNVNGPLSTAPSIFRNSANGMRCESCDAFFSGFVTIENNTNLGLLVDSGRVETSGQQPASTTTGPAQGGPTIIRNIGPGALVDSMSTLRLDATTISGNSEEAVRLVHGSLLESIANNVIPAPSVTCDGTSIVFGDFTGVAAFECEKATKK